MLVESAMVDIQCPTNQGKEGLSKLKARLEKRADAARALQLLDEAQNSNKMIALNLAEQLLFTAVKSTKVFQPLYTVNPHKLLFILLSGRSLSWFDKNHSKALGAIRAQQYMKG
jgi:hypothetical protein